MVIFVTVTTETPLVEVTVPELVAELLVVELVLLVVELVLSSAATRAVASISTSMIQLKIPTIFFMIPPFLLPDNPPLIRKSRYPAGFFHLNVTGQICLPAAVHLLRARQWYAEKCQSGILYSQYRDSVIIVQNPG